jgi:DNA invertase Pin-like site-specific DNA recombinase
MTRNVALIYVRVSRLDTEDRKRHVVEGDGAKLRAISPATQIEQCRALPALRGMQVEVLEDLHRSGKNTKRPGLDRVRERIHQGDVGVIAVWSITRLGRSVVDLYQLLDEFEKADVAFVSAKESIDTSTAYGRAFVGILSVLAQMERELTSERLAANWEQMAHEGRLVGPLPTGYMRDESRAVVIDPGPARIVRTLFEEYASGRHSFRSLAMWANENALRPPQQDRGHVGRAAVQLDHFTADSIGDLVANMRYSGRFIHRPRQNPDGEPIVGNYAPIVDAELWARCVAIRRQQHRQELMTGDRRAT